MTEQLQNIKGLKVLLGVSGGIAAYKAVDLASKLTSAGAQVRTVMTANACELIGPKSFEAVTRSSVFTSLWQIEEYKIGHISLADWADVVVVAPATANIIGKMANGICDDLLSTLLCVCSDNPVLLAPAMNTRMWQNKAVIRNIEFLKQMDIEMIGPEEGSLACGTQGLGRMSEPFDILKAVEKIASNIKNNK